MKQGEHLCLEEMEQALRGEMARGQADVWVWEEQDAAAITAPRLPAREENVFVRNADGLYRISRTIPVCR